jgi:hypothetical protein
MMLVGHHLSMTGQLADGEAFPSIALIFRSHSVTPSFGLDTTDHL